MWIASGGMGIRQGKKADLGSTRSEQTVILRSMSHVCIVVIVTDLVVVNKESSNKKKRVYS